MSEINPKVQLSSMLSQFGITIPPGSTYIRGSDILPPPMSKKEEAEYLSLLNEGSKEAGKKLIEHNLRLVVYIAKRYEVTTHIDIEDLISVGTIGLVKAVNSFDISKNAKLATYSSRCIENEILMFIRKEYRTLSYDEVINTDKDGNSQTISDTLGTDENIIEIIENKDYKQLLLRAISTLTEQEQKIIAMRYGLDGCEEHTQKEVADIMGVTQSYISKIEKRICERLRGEIDK